MVGCQVLPGMKLHVSLAGGHKVHVTLFQLHAGQHLARCQVRTFLKEIVIIFKKILLKKIQIGNS
jgi:hypothetical protein